MNFYIGRIVVILYALAAAWMISMHRILLHAMALLNMGIVSDVYGGECLFELLEKKIVLIFCSKKTSLLYNIS